MTVQKSKVKGLEQSQRDRREDLAKWRAGRTHELALPSGLTVMVADVTIADLMFTGSLPPAILALGEEAAKSGKQELNLQAISKNAAEFGQLINALVKIAVKEPPIADMRDEDHVTLDEFSGDDKMAIFQWVNRETAAVQPFRNAGQPAEAGRVGQTVLDETQLDPAVTDRLDRLADG